MNSSDPGSSAEPTNTADPVILQLLSASPLVDSPDWACDVTAPLHIPLPFQTQFGEAIELLSQAHLGSDLHRWLLGHFRREPLHLAPIDQVERVHQLTPILFEYFKLEQGVLQLGGCTLHDRPLLRRSRTTPDQKPEHEFFDLLGNPLDRVLINDLGLDNLEPFSRTHHRPPIMTADQRDSWRQFVEQLPPVADSVDGDFCAVVWCKYVTGELNATGEGERLRLPFEGWAAQLLNGAARPAPYLEPATGDASYELVRLDDGSLTAANAVEMCAASGKRVLRNELRTCASTGKRALPEFFVTCPVTNDHVLDDVMTACQQCRQPVGPHCLDEQQVCAACRSLKPAGAEDPRLARTLGEYPGLSVFRRWRMAETNRAYILTASALFRQLILVLDSQSLAPLHVATRSRFSRHWVSPSELEQQELLRG